MHCGPEKALIWNVIKRAVLDAAGVIGLTHWEAKRIKREARAWLYDWEWRDEYRLTAFTFPWCCEQLGCCPFEARRKIISELAKGRPGHGLNQQKSTGIGGYFADHPNTPTMLEVYFG